MNWKPSLWKFIPASLMDVFQKRKNGVMRRLKAPRMLWGFENPSGEYCPRTRISDTVFFYHPESIKISDNVFVWHYTILDGTGIGAWVGIFTHSSHFAIRLYGRHYQEVPESEKKGYPVAPVRIGKYVFVGAGSKILPGVSLGDGALISAGSLVNRDVRDFDVVAGNPAKVVGTTKSLDSGYLKDPQLLGWYNEWIDNGEA